ncbi:hypothetical protein FHS91_003768 [Sphingobium xanthum]|uniref:hypothetical protein n=1 Tax=Sphingobium xanthum TaxID=1387165 RepID=UPI001C8C5265|nr:hypothetical protein [Sphingobium xanthum]
MSKEGLIGRRQVLLGASLGALLTATGGVGPVQARVLPARTASVLSFHRDEPWLDKSGLGRPFHAPGGARGGAVLADLSDEALRRLNCFL